MPLDLDKMDIMEYLWDTLDKTLNGAHIRYGENDIEQLWWLGFVDTKRIGLEEWKSAFESYRQTDGSCLLSRDEFLALDHYRYKGEIRVPFDAMKINEGRYTDEGMDDLIDSSVAPSCALDKAMLKEFFDEVKRDFRGDDGLILIKRPAKKRIKGLLDVHPSPLRNLELILDHMYATEADKFAEEIERAGAEAAEIEAVRQASSFSSTPTSMSEKGAQEMKTIAKAKQKTHAADGDGVELKKVKRSRKGMRG